MFKIVPRRPPLGVVAGRIIKVLFRFEESGRLNPAVDGLREMLTFRQVLRRYWEDVRLWWWLLWQDRRAARKVKKLSEIFPWRDTTNLSELRDTLKSEGFTGLRMVENGELVCNCSVNDLMACGEGLGPDCVPTMGEIVCK